MSKSVKNLSIVLGLITIVFAGYYLYNQTDNSASNFQISDQTRQNMLNNTKVFAEYRKVLSTVKTTLATNLEMLKDERFLTLRGYTTEIEETSVGRTDPFADVTEVNPAATKAQR